MSARQSISLTAPDDVASLIKILQKIDYSSDQMCDCLPEYTVVTEHGSYGLSLIGSYARCDKGQAELSAEQRKTVADIINSEE